MNKISRSLITICLLAIASPGSASDVAQLFLKQVSELMGEQEVQMLTVEYAPGESSQPHRHSGHTFVYVAEGTVVMQVAGGEEVTLTVGQTFYENPQDTHTVSKNASSTETAKIVGLFLRPKGTPPTLPVD